MVDDQKKCAKFMVSRAFRVALMGFPKVWELGCVCELWVYEPLLSWRDVSARRPGFEAAIARSLHEAAFVDHRCVKNNVER